MLSELHEYISLRFAVQTSQRVPQGVLTAVYTTAARRQNSQFLLCVRKLNSIYRGAEKSLAGPGRKQGTATEDFEFHISYL